MSDKNYIKKDDFIRKIKDKSEEKVSLKTVKAILKAFEESVIETLKEGNDVKLTGFMNFNTVTLKERTYKNMKTKEPILKPERKTAKARLSKNYREKIFPSK